MKFVHLHNHSHYSLLDGLSKIPDLVAAAKKQGANALALTDHGVMYGVIEFYEECKKAGIKPVIGCELYVIDGDLDDRDGVGGKKNYYHLTLLAKDDEGYKNLMKLTTKAHVDGYYYKPRVNREILEQYSKGLICMTGCLRGELPSAVLEKDNSKIEEIIEWYSRVFKDNYYLEMQHHPNIENQKVVNEAFKNLAKEHNLPLVVSCDSHYLQSEDMEAHEILLCVQTGAKLDDEGRFSMKGEIFDLPDPKMLAEVFVDTPEAISNTQKIADMCNVEIELGKIILPSFELPPGEKDYKSYLEKLVTAGLKKRFGDDISKEILNRVKYEMGIINQMKYESYFLVVEDFIKWSKRNGVVVGPGRGSGAASMVSYALNITDIDPLEYDLIFERFLNPSRISMPDFDIDFADDRRDDVIRYVVDKYGRDRVAQIVTFGTMAARASVRDTGRVLGLPYIEVDKIAKLIPFGLCLEESLKVVDELKELYKNDPKVTKLINLSRKLEGVVRHTSVHAAGVVIADKDLVEYTPLQKASKGETSLVTQYSMGPIEKLGLLKIDFLGLKNLTIIKNALRIIRKTQNKDIDISKLALDDKDTYKLLSKGETTGVFQLESDGMKRNLQNLRPNVFADIIAIVALYRPGPMELIPDFIDRKHGRKTIKYLHPKLEPILKETYGIAVYQEQVLRIARDLCGFSMGEADILRKAIGKKIEKLLMEQKKKFIDGGINNGIDEKIAKQLFEFVIPFAKYGFNKAHATSYALIAYQTAYLKTHFPSEFMAALLTSDQNDLDKVAKDISESEKMNIRVLPPSVNESFTDFAVVKETGNIRFGLNVVKNVGRKVSDLIVEERKRNGGYKNLEDFLRRVPKEALNKKTLEALALAGALDEFGDCKVLFENVESMTSFVNKVNKDIDTAQMGIFGEEFVQKIELKLGDIEPATEKEKMTWEKEFLGTFVSRHPLKDIMPKIKESVTAISSLHEDSDNKKVKIGGIVASVQNVNTKAGEPMAFVRLEDLTGSLEVIVFPKVLQKYNNLFITDKILIIEGKVNVKDSVNEEEGEMIVRSEAKIIVDTANEATEEYIKELATIKMTVPSLQNTTNAVIPTNGSVRYLGGSLLIRLPKNFDKTRLRDLKQILEKYKGHIQVELEIFSQGQWQRLNTTTKVLNSSELEKELSFVLK